MCSKVRLGHGLGPTYDLLLTSTGEVIKCITWATITIDIFRFKSTAKKPQQTNVALCGLCQAQE